MQTDLFAVPKKLSPGFVASQISPEEEIRALSWKQPYASLMLPPFNKIETRGWNTHCRGLVLICASLKCYGYDSILSISGERQSKRISEAIVRLPGGDGGLPDTFGHAIAIGRLVDCRRMRKEDADQCFVEYFSDLYCHIYDDVHPIRPFKWEGGRKWITMSLGQIKQIEII